MKKKGSGLYTGEVPRQTSIIVPAESGQRLYAKIFRNIFNEKGDIIAHEEMPYTIQLNEVKNIKAKRPKKLK